MSRSKLCSLGNRSIHAREQTLKEKSSNEFWMLNWEKHFKKTARNCGNVHTIKHSAVLVSHMHATID
jgi:hypothetical protein